MGVQLAFTLVAASAPVQFYNVASFSCQVAPCSGFLSEEICEMEQKKCGSTCVVPGKGGSTCGSVFRNEPTMVRCGVCAARAPTADEVDVVGTYLQAEAFPKLSADATLLQAEITHSQPSPDILV